MTSTDSAFTVDVPDLFHALPLVGHEAELDKQLLRFIKDLAGGADPEAQRGWVAVLKTLVAELNQQDVRYAGLCCEIEENSISVATLTIATPELTFDDANVAAGGIVQTMGDDPSHPNQEARVLELPCGPAAAIVDKGYLQLPDQANAEGTRDTNTSTSAALALQQVHIYIPCYQQQRLVIIALSTPSVNDWELYVHLTVNAAMSMSFDG